MPKENGVDVGRLQMQIVVSVDGTLQGRLGRGVTVTHVLGQERAVWTSGSGTTPILES